MTHWSLASRLPKTQRERGTFKSMSLIPSEQLLDFQVISCLPNQRSLLILASIWKAQAAGASWAVVCRPWVQKLPEISIIFRHDRHNSCNIATLWKNLLFLNYFRITWASFSQISIAPTTSANQITSLIAHTPTTAHRLANWLRKHPSEACWENSIEHSKNKLKK